MLKVVFLLGLCQSLVSSMLVPEWNYETPEESHEIKLMSRAKRQAREPDEPLDPNCDFGANRELDLCQWMNMSRTTEKWMTTKGENFGWLGGPPNDKTNNNPTGGYALYETSKLVNNQSPQSLHFDSAMMMSPVLENTVAIGSCLDFWYAIEGLSQDRLRILLRPPSSRLEKLFITNMTNKELQMEFMNTDGRDDIVLWEHKDTTNGKWTNGQIVYTFNNKHMLIFEGLPLNIDDPNRPYRGYIAVDDLNFVDAKQCKPFCNFEGGFCSWTQDQNDEFDWTLSRGSINPSTGPPMDRFSFNYGIKGGGYAVIDSGYPRRPFDKARIASEVFSPPEADIPLCMRFWTHMYGNGIGSLRIIKVPTQGNEEIIWELSGEQGNNWYQGQLTITASSDFQIIIEAEVGVNNLGDIAIDEIALKENACPTSPQSASQLKGDCTFEVDECGWKNVEFRQRMDELDWERAMASAAREPNTDHTLKTGLGSYMTLPRNSVQRGERGWFMSPPMEPTQGESLCLSFWYFMYDPFIEQTGPSLGSLRVIMMEKESQGFQNEVQLWSLRNHQGPTWQYGQAKVDTEKTFMIIFEGLWGNSRGSEYIAIDDITFFTGECTTMPVKAESSVLNCDFTRNSCNYKNESTSLNSGTWLTSTISRRPSTLTDHTYGGPSGYVYFDVFSRNNQPTTLSFMSKLVPANINNEPMCITFWFAPIGSDAESYLTVNRIRVDSNSNAQDSQNDAGIQLWRVPASTVYRDRIEWMFGQVEIEGNTDFKISIVGEAKKGGFALDDILVYPGKCTRRPTESDPNTQNNDEGR